MNYTILPTQEDLYEAQEKLERDQINIGKRLLENNTFKLEGKQYASATIYGIRSISDLLPVLVKRIEHTTSRIHQGHNGVAFKEKHTYLANLEPLAAAGIALKLTFDKVFGFKKDSKDLRNITISIGQAIESECRMRHYEDVAPALLAAIKKNNWHSSSGTQHKYTNIKTLMNRYDVEEWKPWNRDLHSKLGGWLLDCILETSGYFTKENVRVGRKTSQTIEPTKEFYEVRDMLMQDAELYAPLTWPMLVEPRDWGIQTKGGYLNNDLMEAHSLIRRDPLRIQGEKPLAFLNKIQKVGYRLNPFTVNVAEELERLERSVGKFLPVTHYDLPPKPVDIAENEESRKRYRREAAHVRNKQSQELRRACRTRQTLAAIRRFKEVNEFFIPWSFDYRGRVYPIPALLTPQDTDFGKSLIRFSNESRMNKEAEEWLSFQCATTYGLDKSTMAERLEWTSQNIPLIEKVAKDPIGSVPDWEAAEEPWQFLAACDEYYHCCIAKDKLCTGLPVATDATCSGLQILAGLARDKKTAQLVNVLPSPRPQDAYKVVAEVSKWNIPDRLREHWDRKCVKRTVMTIPYNAKPFSNRSYIRDALKEKGVEIDKDELTITVKAVREAMSNVVPGCLSVMKWIEDEVATILSDKERNVQEFEWTTPSEFKVRQKIMKKKVESIELKLLGRCQMRIATEDTDKVDKARHKAATAPNLIHSLDASLLHMSVEKFDKPIALIHDSVLCRATDMTELSRIVRETYMELFANTNYLQKFAKDIGAKNPPPIIGDLEPESVIESTYFFC